MKYGMFFASLFAAMAASADVFNASVWRGETAYVDTPEALRDKVAILSGRWTGDDISLTLLRFDEVKYDLVEKYTDGDGKNRARVTGKGTVCDVCREWKKGDMDLPSMIKIEVSPEAKPLERLFELDGEKNLFLLKIVDRVLPPAKEWKYFLDLWQHSWAVSRYFGVEPFSKEHYAKMEPVWRALAECGCKTTFYVCATAMHPNTFMDSPRVEGFWLGAYPVMVGFDGFLRWTASSWPEDPYVDASFKTVRKGNLHWRPGDTFLIYPNGEMSARLIALRAGVVAAEKMRILRDGGEIADGDLKRLAAPYGYKGAVGNAFDFSAFRREVEAFVRR